MTAARSAALDRVKGLLIFLVVWGHFVEVGIRSSDTLMAIYAAIYVVHMPAFVMIAGMVSSAQPRLGQIAWRILLPYVALYIPYAVALWRFREIELLWPWEPPWILWFLLSLAIWRLALPVLLRIPLVLPLSVLVAVWAGYVEWIDRAFFGLSRTLVFLPAFLAGHLYRDRILALRRPVICGLVLAAILALSAWLAVEGSMPYRVLWGAEPFDGKRYGDDEWRLFAVLAGLVSAVAMIGLGWGSAWLGRRTLQIFLGHGLIVLALRDYVPPQVAATLVMALVVSGLLSLTFRDRGQVV